MSDTTTIPTRGASPPGRARAWAMTHRPQAAAAAGGLAVAAFAIVKKRQAGPDAATGDAAATSAGVAAAGGDGSSLTAGLSGTPYTGDTDVYNQIQDQLNGLAASVNEKLNSPTAPTPPKLPTPLPKPGASRWTVHKGDTLAKIAAAVYGQTGEAWITAIKLANPILIGRPATSKLDFFAGATIIIPPRPHRAPAPPPKPTPKPPPKKK